MSSERQVRSGRRWGLRGLRRAVLGARLGRTWSAGLLFTLVTACAPTLTALPKTTALNLRGPAPDVVIYAMSGRCGIFCTAPTENWDYLTEYGALDEVAQSFARQGLRVQVASYSASPAGEYRSPFSRRTQQGYANLSRDYAQMIRTWGAGSGAAAGAASATTGPRVVLLGHSHGAAWMHHLATVYREQPVALLIDLDDTCLLWPTDQFAPGASPGATASTPEGPLEGLLPSDACRSRRIGGQLYRGNDLTPWNVARNLEVHSSQRPSRAESAVWGLNPSLILKDNVRPDGSRLGLDTYDTALDNHSTQPRAGSDSLRWVVAQVPGVVATWPTSPGASPVSGQSGSPAR